MFERFTEKARQVVLFAQQDARELRHDYIGTEHLLLGLLRVEDGVAAKVLGSLGVTHTMIRDEVARIIGIGDSQKGMGQIPFTPRAKKVLELALREALSIRHNYIGTEHILLGLARENEGVAARILLNADVAAAQIRTEVFALLGEPLPQPGLRRRRRPVRTRRVFSEMRPSTQWEYRVERRDALDDQTAEWLNALGAEAWQLTAVLPLGDGVQLIFKRPCGAAAPGWQQDAG